MHFSLLLLVVGVVVGAVTGVAVVVVVEGGEVA